MIASKGSKRTSLMVLLTAIPLTAVPVIAYTYTWIGDESGPWNGSYVWERSGCSPCDEWPDDSGDDAIINSDVELIYANETIDDFTISDADVRVGREGTGICTSPEDLTYLTVDSVTITASSGQTAQMRGGSCQTLTTTN